MKRAFYYVRSIIRNNAGFTDMPRMLTYITTFRCNCRCSMCGSWHKPAGREMAIDEIDRFFSSLPVLDAVRLSGGEPFLRRDIDEIAALAQGKLRPLALHLTTNGMLTDRIVGFCRKRGKRIPLHLMVSLDGMREYHDRIRGKEGCWDRAMETVQRLSREKNELNLRLMVNQTIQDDEGASQFSLLRSLLAPLEVSHGMVLAYTDSATYGTGSETIAPFYSLDPWALPPLLRQASRFNDFDGIAYRTAKRYYYLGLHHRLIKGNNHPLPACAALNSHLRLNPDGSVPVCQFNGRTVGNAADQSIHDIWNSPEARAMRQWVKNCPGCWAECEALPNAIYSGGILSHLLPFNNGIQFTQSEHQ